MEARNNHDYEKRLTRLVEQYTNSEGYNLLHQQVRWNQFRASTTSPEEWQTEILDADANNAEHGFVNALIAEAVCDIDGEDEKTRQLLVATCMLRDLGEVVYGDVNYDVKSKVQKLRELVSLSDTLNSGDFSVLTNEEIEDIIDLRTYTPQFEQSRHEAKVFNYIQRLGWLRTALIASEAAQKMHTEMYGKSEANPAQYYRLLWLTHSVLGNHLPTVIQAASERPSASIFLEQSQGQIEFCFRTLQRDDVQETIHNYYEGVDSAELDPAKQERKLITARQNWREFLKDAFESEYTLDPERFIVDLDHLRSLIGALRKQNRKIVLTSGSFDVLHVPHMRYLQSARERGDVLIVGVDSDEKVRQRKQKSGGPPRPLIPENERAEMVLHSRWADYVIIKPVEWQSQSVIRVVKPDVLVLSEDTHYRDDRKALEELKSISGEVVILPRMGKRTTSSTIRELLMQYGQEHAAQTDDQQATN